MADKNSQGKKIHRAWWILVSCCLTMGSGVGVVQNCVGQFFTPVSSAFGLPIADVSLFSSIEILTMCFSMMFALKLIKRFGLRFMMSMSALFTGGSTILMGSATAVWHLYILAFFQGLGMGCLSTVVVPVILSRWFTKSYGTALGIASSFSGVFGAIMNMVVGKVIKFYSWRIGFVFAGSVIIAMSLPVSLFVLRMDPSEVGLLPFGGEKVDVAPVQEIKKKEAFKLDLNMILILFVAGLIKVNGATVSHIPTMGRAIGITIVDASVLATFCMLGNASSKLIIGIINDKIGARKASYLSLGLILLSAVLILTKNQIAVCFGVFFLGVNAMFSLTQLPLVAKAIMGKERYASAVTWLSVIGYLFFSAATYFIGLVYDISGSYDSVLVMIIIISVVSFIIVDFMFRSKAKQSK